MARPRRPSTPAVQSAARRRPAPGGPRAWQRMLSGRRLDLLDPSAVDIEIEDIAHGLARVARWNGQTRGDHAFSVAQHSLLVEHIAARLSPELTPSDRLMALLHDAPEYVIGDMISPFKAALGVDYKDFEARLEAAVHIRFGLPALMPAAVKAKIKEADLVCAWFEATELAGFETAEADQFFGLPPEGLRIDVEPMPAARAQEAFLARFEVLYESVHGEPPRSAPRVLSKFGSGPGSGAARPAGEESAS